MTKIIGILNPFDLIQTCYVYQNGQEIEIMQGKMLEIPEIILTLAKKYNVNQIDLSGSKNYLEGIIKKTKEKELSKYNMNTLNFNFV